MLRVYLETTIPSYLTARPSRDLVVAANQEITREWWEIKRRQSDLYVSEYVIAEASRGDPVAADERLAKITELPVLDATAEIDELAMALLRQKLLPDEAMADAFHLAAAAVHQMNVLLTWNCTHLANPMLLIGVNKRIMSEGYVPPLVYTPQEMMQEESP